MKFKITRASFYCSSGKGEKPCEGATDDGSGAWHIELQSLEQLVDLQAAVGDDLIIGNDPPSICIYDTYIE